MLRTSDIRDMFLQNFDPDKKMQELIGVSFIADQPAIFGKLNKEYAEKELKWYNSQSLSIKKMDNPPKLWNHVASSKGYINSNYGWCIHNAGNFYQYHCVKMTLFKDKNSRRGIMIYTRPTIQVEYNLHGMDDFICTNAVNYFIRDNKLHCVVQMRSNDAIYGYKNDLYWQQYVLRSLLEDLKEKYQDLQIGDIIWNAASLHVYPRHYYLLEKGMQEKF